MQRRLERFLKICRKLFSFSKRARQLVEFEISTTHGVVNFYNSGAVTHDRRIGSRSESYDFGIYNYSASAVVG
jgi:hypothetical protein